MTSSLAAMLLASLSCGAVTAILSTSNYNVEGHPWSCSTLHGHSALHAVTNAVCVAALTKARLSATGCGFRNANLATVVCHGSTLLDSSRAANQSNAFASFWTPATFQCDSASLSAVNAGWTAGCALQRPESSPLGHIGRPTGAGAARLAASGQQTEPPPDVCRPWCSGDRGDNMMFSGRWNEVTESDSRALPCCEFNDVTRNSPNCGPEPTNQPAHIERLGFTGRLEGWAYSGGSGCKCSPLHPDLRWSASGSCAVLEWSAAGFCKLFSATDRLGLLLIGDSTQQQSAATLMNAIKAGGGDCHPRVGFAMADTLVAKWFGGLNRGRFWTHLVTADHPEFIILTAGAHIHEGTAFTAMLRTVLDENLDQVEASYKSAGFPPPIIMWKTQQPGGCSVDAHKAPRNPETTRCWNSSKENIVWQSPGFHYDDFLSRDHEVARLLRGHPRMSLIDMRMLYWRTDAHVDSGIDKVSKKLVDPKHFRIDCLHYCLKGEVLSSTFPRMAFHEMARRSARIDKLSEIE
eukprot:m.273318 g.273318  ORF g.273318 m.273318 type:complete len:520 (-) comp26884_c0_seq2:95-1654(-)